MRDFPRSVLAAFCITVFSLVVVTVAPPHILSHASTGVDQVVSADKPNIILIVADDATDYETAHMPLTQELLAQNGVTVTDFISPHPVCCPARAELMTSEYGHNNGVRYNSGVHGGWTAFAEAGNDRDNVGVWMQEAGYKTAFVGKFLNGYSATLGDTMYGFDRWNPAAAQPYSYYNTSFWNDGEVANHSGEYVADVATSYTLNYIDDFTQTDDPFFVWISHVGPHGASTGKKTWGPPIPAERHVGMFTNEVAPSTLKPSFNEFQDSSKPTYMQRTYSEPGRTDVVQKLYSARLEALQAIDESTAAIVQKLAEEGELENTYIIYTSDNGFLLGEHRVVKKNLPYEEAMQVPLVIRGPGLPAGEVVDGQALNLVDLAATILSVAGAYDKVLADGRGDGISMLPVLVGMQQAPSTQLIQTGFSDQGVMSSYGWLYRGVRSQRYTYVKWYTGDVELYDRAVDPYQLNNVAYNSEYSKVRYELAQRFEKLAGCEGPAICRQFFGVEPVPDNASAQKTLPAPTRW